MNWKTLCNGNTPYSELLKGLYLLVFLVVQTYPFKSRIFLWSGGPKWDSPLTFELKVREENQLGSWNISIMPTSGPSFIKISPPTFSFSRTPSQTMTLNYTVVNKGLKETFIALNLPNKQVSCFNGNLHFQWDIHVSSKRWVNTSSIRTGCIGWIVAINPFTWPVWYDRCTAWMNGSVLIVDVHWSADCGVPPMTWR